MCSSDLTQMGAHKDQTTSDDPAAKETKKSLSLNMTIGRARIGSKDILQMTAQLSAALRAMSRKGLGMTTVNDNAGKLIGLLTDGDLRRLRDQGEVAIQQLTVAEVMHGQFTTIGPGMLAAEALQIMDEKRINALPVVDGEGILLGALNMHDMLRAGVV